MIGEPSTSTSSSSHKEIKDCRKPGVSLAPKTGALHQLFFFWGFFGFSECAKHRPWERCKSPFFFSPRFFLVSSRTGDLLLVGLRNSEAYLRASQTRGNPDCPRLQGTDVHYRGLRRLGGSAPQTPLCRMPVYEIATTLRGCDGNMSRKGRRWTKRPRNHSNRGSVAPSAHTLV